MLSKEALKGRGPAEQVLGLELAGLGLGPRAQLTQLGDPG